MKRRTFSSAFNARSSISTEGRNEAPKAFLICFLTSETTMTATLPIADLAQTLEDVKPLDFSRKSVSSSSPETSTPLSESIQAMLDAAKSSQNNSSVMIDLQRIIKANQAIALSKMQAAMATAAANSNNQTTFVTPLLQTPPPPPTMTPPQPSIHVTIPPLASATPPMTPDSAIGSPVSNSPALVNSSMENVNRDSLQKYQMFRENMLRQFTLNKFKRQKSTSSSDSSLSSPSPLTPESTAISDNRNETPVTIDTLGRKRRRDDVKDAAYWERRKKNNEAAKRSRDARRAKEDEIAIRAAFLEQENVQLKWEVAKMKAEVMRLKTLLIEEAEDKKTD